jgi:copper chaperone CopZ
MKTTVFDVEGMMCDGCEQAVQRKVGALPGVGGVQASYRDKRVVVQHDPASTDDDAIKTAIDGLGYKARVRPEP